MPFCGLQTNVKIEKKEDFAKSLSAMIAKELSKPEAYVMVAVEERNMVFAGNTEPCAFVDLRSIGLSDSQTPGLSKAICDFLERNLKIDPSRVYVNFTNVVGKMWGWNSSTF